jgi:hypothetical protein
MGEDLLDCRNLTMQFIADVFKFSNHVLGDIPGLKMFWEYIPCVGLNLKVR